MNKNIINEEIINKTEIDYLYYDDICNIYHDIDFEPYILMDEGNNYVISYHDYFKCLLENNIEYKNFVIDDVLYDIYKYGYYANDEIEESLGLLTTILDEEMLRGKIDDEEIIELENLRNKREEKIIDRRKKKDKKQNKKL